jgi:hypothetical protein
MSGGATSDRRAQSPPDILTIGWRTASLRAAEGFSGMGLAASTFEELIAQLAPFRARVHGPREIASTNPDGNGLIVGRCGEPREAERRGRR